MSFLRKQESVLMSTYYVYIMSNYNRTTLYIGVTNDLQRRVFEHKQSLVKGFTKKYNLRDLLYFEETSDVQAAITREKQLKKWKRAWKDQLITDFNPKWKDLSQNWF